MTSIGLRRRFSKIGSSIGLIGALALSGCGSDTDYSELMDSPQGASLSDIRDLARQILDEELASIDDLPLADERERYIGGRQSRESAALRDMVHNLGNMMISSYLNDDDNGLGDLSFPDISRRMLRDAHPKGLLCLDSELEVKSNPIFESGLLGTAGKYPAVVRFSSASPSVQDDSIQDIRGFAVQVDTRFTEFNGPDNSHDFVSLSSPIFPADDAAEFGELVKVVRLANCNDDPRGFFACAVDTGVPNPVTLAKAGARLFRIINSEQENGMLEKKFFSVTPFRYENAGQKTYFKFQFEPIACSEAREIDNRRLNIQGRDNFLADNIRETLERQSACYDLRVVRMPSSNRSNFLEIHTREWEDMAMNLKSASVGTLRFSRGANMLDQVDCENLRFSPAHLSQGFTALGSINRARKVVYEKLANFRLRVNAEIEHAGL